MLYKKIYIIKSNISKFYNRPSRQNAESQVDSAESAKDSSIFKAI